MEAVFDQEFVPNIAGAVLDSAAMLNTLDGALGSGRRIQLRGVTGSMSAEIADAVFPVVTSEGIMYSIRIQGKNIVAPGVHDNLLSLAVLLKAFVTRRPCMPSCMSDPDHFDHVLPFLQPADVPHKIDLTAADVLRMHKEDFKTLASADSIASRTR
jgi:hypothetical protein